MKKTTKVTSVAKVKSLKDLIEATEWVGIQTRGTSNKLPDDAVSIHFTQQSAKSKINPNKAVSENSDWVRLRFGKDVLEKLDWKSGDRIFISNDPDDHLTFLLFKVDSNSGFRLGIESGSTSARIHFSWRPTYVPVKVSSAQLVEYEIHKGKIIFRANPE
jgi:hypothetical protein